MTPSELDELERLMSTNYALDWHTRVGPLIAALREAWAELRHANHDRRIAEKRFEAANKVIEAAQVAIKGRGCECDKCLAFLAALAEFDRSTGGGT